MYGDFILHEYNWATILLVDEVTLKLEITIPKCGGSYCILNSYISYNDTWCKVDE